MTPTKSRTVSRPARSRADLAEGAGARLGADSKPAKADSFLAGCVDLARAAALDVGGSAVGEHVAVHPDGERLVSHAFLSTLPGYTGWYWSVTLARAPRARTATVAEVVLVPGEDALLAPAWVPWNERVRAGDLSPGDLLPPVPDDPRIVASYVGSDDEALEQLATEVGLGRPRVMSREGRLDTAERWYLGDNGPEAPMAKQAPAHCGTCAFLLPLAGSLAAAFGVCANDLTASDGQVVSVEYGCGAHSETEIVLPALSEPAAVVYDDGDELLER